MIKPKIIIGTRGSKLALWQAEWVKSRLMQKHNGLVVELKIIKTKGDRILDVPLAKVGGKGLFVKEIEEALVDNRIDVAVHSMKDMPAQLHEGLCIAAIPERENPCDVLISGKGLLLSQLPEGARIGTSSLRRIAQIKRVRPDLAISPLRGNLDTRIRKLQTGEIEAIILAAAGVKRLGLDNIITQYLDEETMLPAVGQGALCIETRNDDSDVFELINAMDHFETRAVVSGERAFLKKLEGSCQIPVAGYGKVANDVYIIKGLVSDLCGETVITDTHKGPLESSEIIGTALADKLISMGAKKLLESLGIQ